MFYFQFAYSTSTLKCGKCSELPKPKPKTRPEIYATSLCMVLSDFLWCIAFSWKSCCHALFVHKIKPFHFLSLRGFHIQDSPLRKPFTWVLGRSSSHWGDCCCTLLRYLWPLPLLQTQFDCFSAFLFEWTLYASLSYTWMYPEMNYTSKSSTFNGNSKKKDVQLLRFLRKSLDSLSELHIA